MNERGWEDLVDTLDQKYGISSHQRQTEPLVDAPQFNQQVETIEFSKSGETYRVVRTVGPAVVDKKTYYHKVGTSERTQYVYDPDETSTKVAFYRGAPDGSWHEIRPEELLAG